jgi:hypothetical protein
VQIDSNPIGFHTLSVDLEADRAEQSQSLILKVKVAAVTDLPLTMANVALPSIGEYFDASQTQTRF